MKAVFILMVMVALVTLVTTSDLGLPEGIQVDGEFQCEAEGKFPHPTKCKVYYDCVMFFSHLIPLESRCWGNFYFDAEAGECVIGKCPLPLTCTREGYFTNPNNCNEFYRCYLVDDVMVQTPAEKCSSPELVFCEDFETIPGTSPQPPACSWPDQCTRLHCRTEDNLFLGQN